MEADASSIDVMLCVYVCEDEDEGDCDDMYEVYEQAKL